MFPLGPRLPHAVATAIALGVSLLPVQPAAAGSADDEFVGPRRQQTSDGVVGELAAPRPTGQRAVINTTIRKQWEVVPGVQATTYDETTPRGPVRGSLLVVDLATKGLSLDYAYSGQLSRPDKLTQILKRHDAVAGVNGDFFDIGDTGAPLGVGQDRQENLLNAPRGGWNNAFSIDRQGRPDIGRLPMRAVVKEHPRFKITNVNAPEIRRGGIGVYTHEWGSTDGYRVTGGQRKNIRMVVVRRGRVVSNSARLTRGKAIKGKVLIGRGKGARSLARLKKGRKATVRAWLQGRPTVAITGNRFLLRNNRVEVVDDREMHPRTAIGIDYDTNRLFLLVVDGRQDFSRGLTMVELAERMVTLGADEALNLDGGGSSTLVARKTNGRVGVVNSPSDGGQRRVPNGLEITVR